MILESYQHLAALFEMGLTMAVAELKPERAFVAYRGRKSDPADFPIAYATHGFSMAGLFVDEDISTEVVRQTLREGKSQLIVDAVTAPGLNNRTSVILSGLRSVLTVPLRHSNGLILGLFYIDNRVRAGAFKTPHQEFLERLAQDIVARLGAVEQNMKNRPTEIVSHAALAEVRQSALSLVEKGSYTQALGTVEKWMAGREEGQELGLAYGVKSHILQQMGQIEAALEAVAVAVFQLGHAGQIFNEQYALMLNNLAGLHVELGHYHRAHGLLLAAATDWSRLASREPRHRTGLAATQYNLGKLFGKLENLAQAKEWLEKALVTCHKAFGPEHPKSVKIQKTLENL